jgi:hypothetical protein
MAATIGRDTMPSLAPLSGLPPNWEFDISDLAHLGRGLSDDGERLVLAMAEDRRLSVIDIDLGHPDGPRVTHRATFTTPVPMGRVRAIAHGPKVWVLGYQGTLMSLDRERLQQASWLAVPDLFDAPVDASGYHLTPDARFLWTVATRFDSADGCFTIVDVESHNVVGAVEDWDDFVPLVGSEHAAMAALNYATGLFQLHEPFGQPIVPAREVPEAAMITAGVHPSADGLFVVFGADSADKYAENDAVLAEIRFDKKDEAFALLTLPDAWEGDEFQLAASRTTGLVFVQVREVGFVWGRYLLAVRLAQDGLAPVWRIPLRKSVSLQTDRDAQRVVALQSAGPGQMVVTTLGEDPPALEEEAGSR